MILDFFLFWTNTQSSERSPFVRVHLIGDNICIKIVLLIYFRSPDATTSYWIGLYKPSTSWTWAWIDGTAPSYYNWSGGVEPVVLGKCVKMVEDGSWKEDECTVILRFICEKDTHLVTVADEIPTTEEITTTTQESTAIKQTTDGEYVCETSWTEYNDRCYYAVKSLPAGHGDANSYCSQFGAGLTGIDDSAENNFVQSLA